MPHNLNVSTVIDKNKLTSVNAFLILLEVFVKDASGTPIETIRLVQNSEDVIFETNTFTATNFDLDIKLDAAREPSITLKAHDETRLLAQYIDDYDGLVGNKLRVIIVNSGNLSAPAEIDEELIVLSTNVSSYTANIELGMESAGSMRFPKARQFKERCWKTFKSPRCGYAGADLTCSYTRTGTNSCSAKGNEINFGGFPGINELF
jgi:hypothetical protein